MWSSRDRARRDYAPPAQQQRTDSRSDTRSDHRADGRRTSKRPRGLNSSQSEQNRKRIRAQPPGTAPNLPGSIGCASKTLSSDVIVSTPRLSELRESRRSGLQWSWDKHADGYENVSAKALKLLGYASPESTYSAGTVPEEIVKIRNAKPISAWTSWLMSQVGSEIYDSPRRAAKELCEHGGIRPPQARLALAHEKGGDLFTDADAVIVRHAPSRESIEARYQLPIAQIEQLNSESWVVKFKIESQGLTLQDGDSWLFPVETPTKPVIEVLNAFPLAKPDTSEIIRAMTDMCAKIGHNAARVWQSENDMPYRVSRIFIELQDSGKTREAAAMLGEMKLQERPLVTALNFDVGKLQRREAQSH